ncbi:MAG: UDP-3-O-(3-hydroxymyristoyl)glucosamine N-acyltransferase [Bacteriovorax sp.]
MKLGNLKNAEASFQIVHGNADLEVIGITDNHELLAGHFVFIKNKIFLNDWLSKTEASKPTGLVIEKSFFEGLDAGAKKALEDRAFFVATVDNVNLGMSRLSKPIYDEKFKSPNDIVDGRQMGSACVDSSAWIAQGAFVGENVSIAANAKVHSGVVLMSGVEIQEGTEIFPNTVIYRNVKIGKNVRIHANCTIGADGFGYNFFRGEHLKVWHMGSVIIHDHVEIGANSCIDGGTFSPTIIGAGSKIDNQVQIGHNCRLGRGVIICGQTGVAGSCTFGDYAVIGGKVAISNGITIGKAAQVAGNAGVTGNVADGEVVGGFPARNIKEWLKGVAYLRKITQNKE